MARITPLRPAAAAAAVTSCAVVGRVHPAIIDVVDNLKLARHNLALHWQSLRASVRAPVAVCRPVAVLLVPARRQLAAPAALRHLAAQLRVVDAVVLFVAQRPVLAELLLAEARVRLGRKLVVAGLDLDRGRVVEAWVARLVHLVVQALHLHAHLLQPLVELALIHAQALHAVEGAVAHARLVARGDLLVGVGLTALLTLAATLGLGRRRVIPIVGLLVGHELAHIVTLGLLLIHGLLFLVLPQLHVQVLALAVEVLVVVARGRDLAVVAQFLAVVGPLVVLELGQLLDLLLIGL
mmetsp:Transcript_22627/g.69911  ORF Transcript_22627/g.69911 Transcript_22627/m.69911 type:complete len:295 (-) Transcript_22627:2613-3497(-)